MVLISWEGDYIEVFWDMEKKKKVNTKAAVKKQS